MVGKHPQMELAPRDIVVKEMVKIMSEQDINFVFLDATHMPKNLLKVRFPNIIAKLKENGLDLSRDLIKVFPAAHYLNGGIKTDLDGYTDIKGLFACGETSATGAHGANRLASNSLIEGLVFGFEISREVLKRIKKSNDNRIDKNAGTLKRAIKNIKIKNTGSNKPMSSGQLEKMISDFRKMMTNNVGILRDEKSLEYAKKYILQVFGNQALTDDGGPAAIELLNMLIVGYLITKSASIRKESRGTHQRNDFPETDDKNWKKHIILKNEDIFFEPVT